MIVKLHVRKYLDMLGNKMVELKIETSKHTSYIFVDSDKKFVLRRVINNCFVDERECSNYARVKVNSDDEIRDMVEKIFNVYKQVFGKDWQGEYEIVKEIETEK